MVCIKRESEDRNTANPKVRLDLAVHNFKMAMNRVKYCQKPDNKKYSLRLAPKKLYKGEVV